MPELRKDPVIGRWVIISSERSKRPSDFAGSSQTRRKTGLCPFCPGNESATPPEIMAVRPADSAPNTPGWNLRVISNKFPALRIEGELNRVGVGIFDKMNGIGAHEVIVETPDHEKDLVDLPVEQVEQVLWAYRERTQDLARDPRLRYVMVFKNQGEAAGASLEHSHSQLIATPVVPKRVQEELDGAKKYFDYKERCIFCDIIRQERETQTRVIAENDHFICVAPFAPRFPFETWLLPRFHQSHFGDLTRDRVHELASLLKDVLFRVRTALEDPPYNYVVHTAPVMGAYAQEYHWHFEIIPKLTKVAGFEWGTGFYINPTAPEEAARYLREIQVPTGVAVAAHS
jgi:UDPglucose--hexose-1-phosphate uridylyltransferase